MTTPSTSSNIKSKQEEIKDVTFKDWLNSIYDLTIATEDFILNCKEAFEYKGFDQQEILANLHKMIKDPRIIIQIIIATAVRGPMAASKLKMSNNKTPVEMGIAASGGKGDSKKVTLNKIVSCTADLAAYYLKMMKVKPRMISPLPAWLQFPSAGSIKLPDDLRAQHKEFCIKFSKAIGGSFNESIYDQMIINSYLNPKLNLF